MRHFDLLSRLLVFLLLVTGCSGLPAASSTNSLEGLQAISLYEDEGEPLPAFALTDTRNEVFDNTRLQGRWTLLYFGYTHCPDICPTALSTLAAAVRAAEKTTNLDQLQVIFVTIDPERDDMPTMKEYVRYFHPRFIGARAPLDQTRVLTNALGIRHYINKSQDGTRYNVNHSGDIAVIDPQGRHIGMIQPPMDNKAITHDLTQLLR